MATEIQYKDVKNPNKPGRAPAGCVWVKEDGQLLRNEQGQVAYRPMTATDKRRRGGKKSAKRPAKAAMPSEPELAPGQLLKKRTYQGLSFQQLEEVSGLVADLIERRRAAERERLEAELAAVKDKLKRIA